VDVENEWQNGRRRMKTKRLGNTDMHIPPIGFGSWAIGGGNWEFGWGPQDEHQASLAIERAVDLGMNWIDNKVS
jgi:aryl-alcohol dehydrogenase-like predicted oxidoreductase